MKLLLKVEVPTNVDESTLSHLLAAVHAAHGITVTTSDGVCLDLDLLDVERIQPALEGAVQ